MAQVFGFSLAFQFPCKFLISVFIRSSLIFVLSNGGTAAEGGGEAHFNGRLEDAAESYRGCCRYLWYRFDRRGPEGAEDDHHRRHGHHCDRKEVEENRTSCRYSFCWTCQRREERGEERREERREERGEERREERRQER
ncbi:hypothetical protein QJS04_geneDACA000448 [Acorus gramineus]|uniref:Uncharacterized protein n=1 Tax=Acorus gramineus TaxID=55184 RepID=A0AAV9AQD2_ACOGR|nr:hypothetical protein QJS04_geneDACA000448 [Acorus gramineus]